MFTYRYIQCLYCTVNCHQPTSLVGIRGTCRSTVAASFRITRGETPCSAFTRCVWSSAETTQRCVDSNMVSMKFRRFLGIHHKNLPPCGIFGTRRRIKSIRTVLALPQRCSVEGSHSQSNVVATLHSIGKTNKGIREY